VVVTEFREHWHVTADGTRLFARDCGPLDGLKTPVLCLPGLTRHSMDFAPVFDAFGARRRIIAMDFRGRGRSARAADSASYRPDVEVHDTLGFLKQLDVPRVALLGTSRGGIVGLLIAALGAQVLAGLLLNDIGCELEATGMQRIKDYVGKPKCYRSWDEAAKAIAAGSNGFANVSNAQWQAVTRRIYIETPEGICPSHDPRLADTLPSDDDIQSGKVAELWSLLPALYSVPFSLLRGAGSDLLAVETVARMKAEAPHLQTHEVADRGHVPFLDEPESVAAISTWLQEVDKDEKGW
jgi:pimeloyl-ACP methyl ester carboxylesterase